MSFLWMLGQTDKIFNHYMSLGKHQVPQKQTKKRVENYQNRNRIKTEKSKEISKV